MNTIEAFDAYRAESEPSIGITDEQAELVKMLLSFTPEQMEWINVFLKEHRPDLL